MVMHNLRWNNCFLEWQFNLKEKVHMKQPKGFIIKSQKHLSQQIEA